MPEATSSGVSRVYVDRVDRGTLAGIGKRVGAKVPGIVVVRSLGDTLKQPLVAKFNAIKSEMGAVRKSTGVIRDKTVAIPFAMVDVRGSKHPRLAVDDVLAQAAKPVSLLVIRSAKRQNIDKDLLARVRALPSQGTTVVIETVGAPGRATGALPWSQLTVAAGSRVRPIAAPGKRLVPGKTAGKATTGRVAGRPGLKGTAGKAVQVGKVVPTKKGTGKAAMPGRKVPPGKKPPSNVVPPGKVTPPGPSAPPGSPEGRPIRHVNVLVAKQGSDQPVPDSPLKAHKQYDVLVNIGAYREASLLSVEDGQWPDEALPEGDLWLRAVLRMDGWSQPVTAAFSLPAQGESFACDCDPAGAHTRTCQQCPWLRLPVSTPATAGVWQGVLAVYYGVVPVHVQRLTLPVGDRLNSGPRSRVVYRLTRAFADLGPLATRVASVYWDPKYPQLLVNGLGFVDNPFTVETNAADAIVRDTRKILYATHLRIDQGREVSNYSATFSKPVDAFVADLRRLAFAGMQMYEGLFRSEASHESLPYQIRTEARARGRAPILSIASPPDELDEERQVPWSLVYDLPLGLRPDKYRLCESVQAFGPGGTAEQVPPHCPFGDHLTDEDDVLCLFGFWGLSCLLEHPPHTQTEMRRVVAEGSPPVSMLMASDTTLNAAITSSHLADLKNRTGLAVEAPAIETDADLARALAGEVSDIAYLYCHCGYFELIEGGSKSLYLNFGDAQVGTSTIGKWARKASVWPRPHWPQRKPLVVLNGCHTVERTSGTLSNFVESFINRAGASGVIGTEVALDQAMAGHMMGIFMQRMRLGDGVGEALRQTRWQLLRLGNVMGLAYTPYCLAELSLRNRIDQEAAA